MIPNVNTRGTSFKGVTAYLMHDKDKAKTSERVAWTSTRNMITDNIETAAKIMAFTDMGADEIKRENGGSTAGAKSDGRNVYHFSLSVEYDTEVSKEQWLDIVAGNLKVLGLENHQASIVCHDDEPQAHVHVVVNLVNPQTGVIQQPRNDFYKMDKWSHEYELEHGIVCKERDKKYKRIEQEKDAYELTEKSKIERTKIYKEHLTQSYIQSDNAVSFVHAMEEKGLELARGNKRGFVVVDTQGDVFALARLVDGVKQKEITIRLAEFDNDKLQDADKLAKEIKAELSRTQDQSAEQSEAQEQKKQDYVNEQEPEQKPEIFDRDQYEADQQKALADAALVHAVEQEQNELEELAKIKAEREKKEFFDIARGQQKKPDTQPNIAPQVAKQTAGRERLKKQNGDWLEGLNKIYAEAKDGLEFRRRIQTELGLTLAVGNHKQLIIVDANPRINSLVKNIEGQNTQQINTRLGNVNADTLQDADKVKKFLSQERFSARNHAQAALINQYREYWEVDYLQGQINARENIINDFSTLQKVTRRKDIKRMGEEITAYQKSLRHAKVILSHDINAVYDKAPDFVRREQLKKHGVLEQGAGKYIDKSRQLEADKDLKAVQYQKMKISIAGGLVENHGIQERAQAEELRVQAQREQKKALALEKLKEVEQVRIETERTRRFSLAAEKVQHKKLGAEFEKTAEEERRKPVTLEKTKAQEQPEITPEQAAMLDSDREKLTPEFQAQQPAKQELDTPEPAGWKNADPEFLEEVKERRKMFEKDQDQEPERGQGYD